MTKTVYIFEPDLAKSLAMEKLLQDAAVNVVAVAIDEVEKARLNRADVELWQDIKPKLNEQAVLLPTGIISTRIVLEEATLARQGVIMDKTALAVCHKPWLLEQAAKAGVPVPLTWKNPDEISHFPVFYKEEYEAGGGVRGIARNRNELPKLDNTSLIFQEFIESQGTYGVAFFADKGKILTASCHFEQYSLPASGGSAVYLREYINPRLLHHAETLLAALNYSGWGLVEFKFDPKRDDFVLMEINSKIWASIEFSLRNNPDLAPWILGTAINAKPLSKVLFWDNFVQREPRFIFSQLRLLCSPIISYNGIWQGIKQVFKRER